MDSIIPAAARVDMILVWLSPNKLKFSHSSVWWSSQMSRHMASHDESGISVKKLGRTFKDMKIDTSENVEVDIRVNFSMNSIRLKSITNELFIRKKYERTTMYIVYGG